MVNLRSRVPGRHSASPFSRSLDVKMKNPDTKKTDDGCQFVVEHSSYYKEYLAEREEILRHKWIESQKLGYDIGFDRALMDWTLKYRDGWRASRRNSQPCVVSGGN